MRGSLRGGAGWAIGGGSALAARWQHRWSKDLDIIVGSGTEFARLTEAESGSRLQPGRGRYRDGLRPQRAVTSPPHRAHYLLASRRTNRSDTPHAAAIFVTVPNRGSRFPDRPRESATRSTSALRAMAETPPWAAATLRNAFINSRGSPSDSSIAALRYAATSSGVLSVSDHRNLTDSRHLSRRSAPVPVFVDLDQGKNNDGCGRCGKPRSSRFSKLPEGAFFASLGSGGVHGPGAGGRHGVRVA